MAHGLSWDENYGAGGVPGGGNIAFDVPGGVDVLFSYDLATHVLTVSTRAAGATPDLTQAKAQWLRRGLLAWDVPDADTRRYRLHWSGAGDLAVDAEAVTGGSSVPLNHDPAGLPPDVLADFPHLADYEVFRLRAQDLAKVPQILQGQLAVASYDPSGALFDATGVQVPGVLDDVYASAAASRTLGVSWSKGRPTVTVWAPTAQDVDLRLWPTQGAARTVAMERHGDGTWSATGPPSWSGASYLFDLRVWSPSAGAVVRNQVTDPYSVALTANSQRSLMVDLHDRALVPSGWSALRPPPIAQPEDRTVYELHVRDFSIGDATVPAAERGTYLAFTRGDSAGMRHLRRLADAGLNTVHLLPAFDIATIEERRAAQATPACDLASYAPDSEEQQDCVDDVRARDGFNWGYDPLHYTAPEGSYATDPDGPRRTLEFRRMVQGLNGAGLQVVMDVVYNHTAAAGQDAKSVLDRIVPGYYHRLNARGGVENSTCCANTATEHAMMEKLMIDSVLTWAREYKVNGFRFDLMGHHSLQNMLNLRAALDDLTIAQRRRGRSVDLPLRRGLELRRGRRRRPLRAGHPGQPGRHGHRVVLRPAARRRPRWWSLRRGPAGAGLRLRAVHRPQRVPGQRHRRGPAGRPPPRGGPGQARPGREPRRLRVPQLHRGDRGRQRGRLQRATGRVRRRPERGRDLRGRARQRDPVRRARPQAAARHPDGRSGADEHALAVDGGALPECRVLARGHRPAALEVAGPQLLRLRGLVQPGRLDRAGQHLRVRSPAGAGQRLQVAVPAGRCWATRP